MSDVITNHAAETSGLFLTANPEIAETNPLAHTSTVHAPTFRQEPDPKTSKVYLTGFSTMNGNAVVCLSNGEVFTSDDRKLQFVSRRMAIINGRKYLFAPFPRPPDDNVDPFENRNRPKN